MKTKTQKIPKTTTTTTTPKKETILEKTELIYNILKNFRGRQIKNLNIKECKMLINAYGDQTGELSANTPIQFLRYRKNTKTCWQEVLINNIGKEITKTDYI